MKILHIVDAGFFAAHRKTVSDTILALGDAGVEQEAMAREGEGLGLVSSAVPLAHFRGAKDGRMPALSNRIRMWRELRSFAPDLVLKWGREARELAPSGRFAQVSFLAERENLRLFDRSDYIMANLEGVLAWAKENGFSGAKSFALPPFAYEYGNMPPASRRDFFIPEKARIVYISGNFERGIGYETLFEAIPSLVETYFLIAGAGRDEEYIKDRASRANVKSRSRFIPEIERTAGALALADFVLLPFDSSETAKDILEAQLGRKAVITLGSGAAREFVSDGRTGFTAPKGDAYLLRQKIKEVAATDAAALAKITDAAYEQAKGYTAERVIPGYVGMFEELVEKYRARRNLLH
jgi:glycosyltransferase involved in cell wall biosynthesis